MKKRNSITAFIISFMLPGIASAQVSEGGALSQEIMVMAIFSVLMLMVFVLIAVIFSLVTLKKAIR